MAAKMRAAPIGTASEPCAPRPLLFYVGRYAVLRRIRGRSRRMTGFLPIERYPPTSPAGHRRLETAGPVVGRSPMTAQRKGWTLRRARVQDGSLRGRAILWAPQPSAGHSKHKQHAVLRQKVFLLLLFYVHKEKKVGIPLLTPPGGYPRPGPANPGPGPRSPAGCGGYRRCGSPPRRPRRPPAGRLRPAGPYTARRPRRAWAPR